MINNIKAVYEQLDAMSHPTVMQTSMRNMIKAMMNHDLKAYADAGNQIIVFNYTSDMVNVMVECTFRNKSDSVIMTTILPLSCCEEKRCEMETLLHLINYGTVHMPFEYDPRDGECRIKAAHYCGDNALSVKQADHMIWLIIAMLHQYKDTLIPLAMGIDPDYRKTCTEYNELKLSAMNIDKDEEDEEASQDAVSSEDEEDGSIAEDDGILDDDEVQTEQDEDDEPLIGEDGSEEDEEVYDMLRRLMEEALQEAAAEKKAEAEDEDSEEEDDFEAEDDSEEE